MQIVGNISACEFRCDSNELEVTSLQTAVVHSCDQNGLDWWKFALSFNLYLRCDAKSLLVVDFLVFPTSADTVLIGPFMSFPSHSYVYFHPTMNLSFCLYFG